MGFRDGEKSRLVLLKPRLFSEAACTPGTESFEVRGPGRYSVKCGVGSGLVRVHVVLEAELHDLQHPESLRLRATGTAPGSTLDVDTLVRLERLDAQRTRLTWSSVTGVHGMLAGFDITPGPVPGARGHELQKKLFDAGLHIKTTGDAAILAPALQIAFMLAVSLGARRARPR